MSSKLESVPDKVMFKMLKKVLDENGPYKNYRQFISDAEGNTRFIEKVVASFKVFGANDLYEDFDYVASLIELNFDKIIQEEFINLMKPEYGKYDIDFRVTLSEYKGETWRHRNNFYSEKTAELITKLLEMEGEVAYWEGTLVDTDVYDSETSGVNIESIHYFGKVNENKKPLKEEAFKSLSTHTLDDLFKIRQILENEIKLRLKE